ncbi:hypothetical protein PISMIDRAFT_19036 [Pisolithus microcarpus 441]|uniref:Uncharacterized protein n=1 Tax=Pisolithus microcarpus 441 TaxID=765257 RepID=A0A0C9YP08_9AGAM|nr:hypothetical protein PISMIDRAFT_19036 [Pisolithus microcarpus 441]
MARTKQTAKKTASGIAPRVWLILGPPASTSGKASKGISRTTAHSSKTTRGTSPETTSSLSSLTTVPSSPARDTISSAAPRESLVWTINKYCYLCHDGSRYLFCCDSCPRVVCERCLGLVEVDPTLCDPDVKFKCPGCHELDERIHLKRAWSACSGTQETGFYDGGMEHWGSLPQLLHMTLKEYHTEDSLTYEEVTFDLGTNTKLAQWIRKAGRLGTKLAARDFRCKIIFVKVHSEVTCGDLFAGKNEGGEDVATAIEDFMHYVFSPPLHELVYASTPFMLTCGHLVAFEESFMAMKQAITRLRPEYTILFTAPDFISAVTKMFTVAYSIQVLVQGHTFHEILLDLLNVSLDLRMHTDLLSLRQSLVTDILGTTAIDAHGAFLCPLDAQDVVPFVHGPNQNVT